jgi:transposase
LITAVTDAVMVLVSEPSIAAELMELRTGLAEARAMIGDLREVVEAKDAELAARDMQVAALRATNQTQAEQLVTLAARVEELEGQKARDSGNSGKPPSSDSIYTKKTKAAARERSLREPGQRKPGKQPGEPGAMMRLLDNPDARIECPPPACEGCGADLTDAPVEREQRRQVTEAQSAPPPVTTEFVVQAKRCACCGMTSVGEPPPYVSGRAQFGPETHAPAANLVCGHPDQAVDCAVGADGRDRGGHRVDGRRPRQGRRTAGRWRVRRTPA